MGNIYWPQVAKKNSKRKTTYAEASLYLNTHLDWLLNFAHHSKDCWSHLRSQYKDVALEPGASKEGEGRMLHAVCFCAVALGKLDLVLCVCSIHVRIDVWSLSHCPECSVWSFIRLWSDLLFPMASCQWINPPNPQKKKDPCNTYEAFVLPVSLQLRIIVSLRSCGPVICHPWSPKGGYVSPQVVGVCRRGWGADKGRLDIDLITNSVKMNATGVELCNTPECLQGIKLIKVIQKSVFFTQSFIYT